MTIISSSSFIHSSIYGHLVTSELTKQNNNKLIDTDNGMMVTGGKGGGRKVDWAKRIKYMVMEGKYTFGSKYAIE